MTALQVLHGGMTFSGFDDSSGNVLARRLGRVHALRSILLVSVFLVALAFQLVQGQFLSTSVWIPVYSVLAGLFFCNALYFTFADQIGSSPWIHGGLFALDTVGVSLVVFFTGSGKSLFLFLFLVNILLCALIFGRRGAFTLALWTSCCFGISILMGGVLEENAFIFASLNHVAFFAMAYLGGILADQLEILGTQLVARTRDLAVLQDLHRLIVDNMGSGLITVGLDGRIGSANPKAQEILDGLATEGRSVFDLLPGVELAGKVVRLEAASMGSSLQELTYVNAAKQKLRLEVTVTPLRDATGDLQGQVILFQDRTEIRNLEENMRQKEKLAAVGQLAAGIAHEIRNPLASLSGSIQLMASQSEKYDAEDLKLMRIVMREIDRLNGLISEFLDYVKPETKPDQPVDPNAILREVLEMVRFNANLRQEVEPTVKLQSGAMVLGHRDKLKQAFLNIIINAYQAMEKTKQPKLVIETEDRLDWVMVRVSDNGAGMSEETRRRLFEPFYTTKPKGTGLGLALTMKILEVHDAEVQVESAPGQGSEFRILLPAHHVTRRRDLPRLGSA